MNNKGYMLYELVIAFVLTTIIAILLLSTSFKLSEKNSDLIISSKMNIMQENLTSRFYDDAMLADQVYFVGDIADANSEYCTFSIDGTEVRFGTRKATNSEGKEEQYVFYNGYEEKLPSGVSLKTPAIKCSATYQRGIDGLYDYSKSIFHNIESGNKNSAITISVGITDNYAEKDYDINILYIFEDKDEDLEFSEV